MLMLYCAKCEISDIHKFLQFENNFYDYEKKIIFVLNPKKTQVKKLNLIHIDPIENQFIAIPPPVAEWLEKVFSETAEENIDIDLFQNEFEAEIEKVLLAKQLSETDVMPD